MKLFIDTSSNQKTVVGLDELRLEKDSSVWHSQIVIPLIQELLKQKKAQIGDIRKIEVVTGPGSYTGLRVGAAIANALGFALKVPVNGRKISAQTVVQPIYK